jgi:putative addiction module component (TIGR02574 family)
VVEELTVDKALIDSVLRLKPADRMRLLNVIYTSLDRPDLSMDEIWYEEAERRLAAHRAGDMEAIPAERVLGKRP